MKKISKISNILKNKRIRMALKEKGLKINKDSLKKIDDTFSRLLANVIEILSYNMKITGRKTIKIADVGNAFNQLKKEERYFEI